MEKHKKQRKLCCLFCQTGRQLMTSTILLFTIFPPDFKNLSSKLQAVTYALNISFTQMCLNTLRWLLKMFEWCANVIPFMCSMLYVASNKMLVLNDKDWWSSLLSYVFTCCCHSTHNSQSDLRVLLNLICSAFL